MLNPLVAKLLKQVDSWQSEARHNKLPSPQSTLTDSEGLDARDGNGDRRDVMLEVQANLAKSQQEHADRMARIRQDYTDSIARIEADRKPKPSKPAHAATAPMGRRRIVSLGEPSKSRESPPQEQHRLGTMVCAQQPSVRADARAAREEVRVVRDEVSVVREEARVSSKAEAVATGSVMELRTLTTELQCKLDAATEAQLNWENHKLQERGAELLAASGSQAEELKAMLATASEARVSVEAELAAAGSQVKELKAMLATAREEAREAQQVAHRAASEGACISAEAEVALTELRALASEMESKLEAAREVELRRTAIEAQLCRENQQLHARVAALLTELEAKPEVVPVVDLVLNELKPKPKTTQPSFRHPPSKPASPARTKPVASSSPTLPAHLRPVNLKILEQQARLMTQSSDKQESAKVNKRLELARLHNRHVAKMGPAATKLSRLARGHLTRARLRREREAARMAELQREMERVWAKTLSRPAPNGRRGKLTRRQHVLEREAANAYFNLGALPPRDSEVAKHARLLASAITQRRVHIEERIEGIRLGTVVVVDPRVTREERLRERRMEVSLMPSSQA